MSPRSLEHRARPADDDLVGHRETAACGEHLAGVAHRHPVAEHLGHAGERGGEVDGAEHPHLRGRGEALDEHRHDLVGGEILRGGLALHAVATHAGAPRLELGDGVAADHTVELGVAERALGRAIGAHEEAQPEPLAGDDRRQGDGLTTADRPLQVLVDGHRVSSVTS